MAGLDLDAEIREHQWRRKFERESPRTLRGSVIATIFLLMLGVIAHSTFWR